MIRQDDLAAHEPDNRHKTAPMLWIVQKLLYFLFVAFPKHAFFQCLASADFKSTLDAVYLDDIVVSVSSISNVH